MNIVKYTINLNGYIFNLQKPVGIYTISDLFLLLSYLYIKNILMLFYNISKRLYRWNRWRQRCR